MRTAEELRRRKNSKQIITFNLLLLGEPGIGKNSFLENLAINNPSSSVIKIVPEDEGTNNNTLRFESSIVKIKNELTSSIILNVTSADIMNQLNSTSAPKKIREYIETQLNSFLTDEFRVLRNQEYNGHSDKRLHACIFFVNGNAKGLHTQEIDTLKEISSLINVILAIGKADRFNTNEIKNLKRRINEDIIKNDIKIFDFNDDYLDDIFEDCEHILVKEFQPFTVISGNILSKPGKELYRQNVCSKMHVDDIKISNLSYLKGIILGSHIQELQTSTNSIIYEKFRTKILLERQNEINIKNDIPESDPDKIMEEATLSPLYLTMEQSPQGLTMIPDADIMVGKELQEKNKIIEAYQRKIDALEKIIQHSNDSSPTTKVTFCELEGTI
ncbi:hypothetical protein C6P45_004277 [Maudiozyma exigua]|uniref:Septin-type G domain-containing protein n=1 Tax=Maudiozyma exigua TaxID=34358 RepID=A0A9P6WAN2_MAUEX|nr:hypothetical protein C6P45_004277 [Kazachstania exigua]